MIKLLKTFLNIDKKEFIVENKVCLKNSHNKIESIYKLIKIELIKI
jgi:hypothetical protein